MSRKVVKSFFAACACALLVVTVQAQDGHRDRGGNVFVMNNDVDQNRILVYSQTPSGLRLEDKVATGGRGSGGVTDPLQSQGSLTLSQDHSFLLAVNAGSGTISSFRIRHSGLDLADRTPSGGSFPIAVAEHGGLVYVLDAGGNDSVVGFRLDWRGRLARIPGSVRRLSNNDTGASSLAFSPDGLFLAVTERLNNQIEVFHVNGDGTLSAATITPSNGQVSFSAAFAPNGALLVTEAGSSAISSYAVQSTGALSVISGSVATLGGAPCWHEITPNGKYAYASNSGTSSLAGFSIGNDGSLTPLAGTVVGNNPTGATNLDITISSDGKFLYTLNSGNGTVGVFAIHKDGSLEDLGPADGLHAASGFNGIAAD
ncbi:MAG TPA: beta-propeller fold lactonase family protein [Terriglobales bacterium]|nr:beta-propeller fold lactonase family protein [Terriglobales bacterium]